MKLRRVDIEVFDYFTVLGIPREVFSPLRSQAEVLSWHLWRFLRSVKVDAPVSRTRVLAQTKEICSVTDQFYFIKVNPDPPFDVEKGPLEQVNLNAMTSLLVRASQSSFATDWSWLEQALSDFKAANFEANFVRAYRRPRGTKVEMRLEERVSHRAASIDFVALHHGEEIHRETVSQIPILPSIWSGKLRKILIDGDRVTIEGRIPTAIPPQLLNTAHHGATRDNLEFYVWSRTLSELGLPIITSL